MFQGQISKFEELKNWAFSSFGPIFFNCPSLKYGLPTPIKIILFDSARRGLSFPKCSILA